MGTHQSLDTSSPSQSKLQAWRTQTLNYVLIVVAIAIPLALGDIVRDAFTKPEQQPIAFAFIVCYLLVLVLTFVRKLDFRLRVWGFFLIGYATAAISLIRAGQVGDGRIYLIALPVIAFILADVPTGFSTSLLSIVTLVIFTALVSTRQLIPPSARPNAPTPTAEWTQGLINLGVLLAPVVLLLWRFIRFHERTLSAERAATQQLAESSALLRQQAQEREENTRLLAERSEALSIAAEVAQQIAALTNEQELIDRFVNLMGERFHLYHVGIFLPDAQRKNLALRAASSEGGRQMIQEKYQLTTSAIDAVAQAAQNPAAAGVIKRMNQALPQLPQSQWQVALPLQAGQDLLAVLDIHFSSAQPPTQEQIGVLSTLANQLAVGLQNARLFAQTQASLEELTGVYHSMTAEAWQQFIRTTPGVNRYQAGKAQLPEQAWQTLFAQAKAEGQPVSAHSAQEAEAQHLLAVPIKLRGIPIGAIGFHRPEQAGEWQPDEIALAERVAERAAIALENVRLIKDARQRAAREQLLGAVATRVRSGLTLEQVLNNTVRQIGQAMGAVRVAVQLHLPDEKSQEEDYV